MSFPTYCKVLVASKNVAGEAREKPTTAFA
jgi:hypothetical protein